ncbi:hypothetical protein ACFP3Q_16865 [Nocardioides sp. GCM10027113]|uniref:hypothetical protein n=1 Tax=unclassified Nocardioides TaxID=2615069 RepID=UPI003615FFAF
MQQGDADSATQELVPVPGAAGDPDGWRGAWRALGWALLAAWVVTTPAHVVLGDSTTDPVEPLRVSGIDDGGNIVTVAMLGREADGGLALTVGALWLASVGLLVLGPRPRRATRWSWFWLLCMVPPVGVLAFLALGGPTSLVRPSADPDDRLSGFMGFGLLVIVGNAVTWAVALATVAS